MKQKTKTAWDRRCVDFTKVHGIEDEAFDNLVKSLNLKEGMIVGDIMCGYGAVSRKVLEYCSKRGFFVKLILSDAFESQLARSYQYLTPFGQQGYAIQRILSDTRCLNLEEKLDRAILKMGLHEVRKQEQYVILQRVYNSLKNNGEIYIWESMGQDPELNTFFRRIVRKKDELAGFRELVENRYFSNDSEINEQLISVGFNDLKTIYRGNFDYVSRNFLDSDFQGDQNKLEEFHTYLRSQIPESVKRKINFEDSGCSISMRFVKKIIKARK